MESGTIQKQKVHRYPITEVFGPTIQGEGPEQGRPVHFIRTGGCDYKCEWCDTPFAVLPGLVRQNERLTNAEIISRISRLPHGPDTIVISGGNPLLHELGELVDSLQFLDYRVTVETQATVWKNWLPRVNGVVLSPKPPSSGMKTDLQALDSFVRRLQLQSLVGLKACFKIVVFDRTDYIWARELHATIPRFKMYLSAGNDAGATVGNPGRKDERNDQEVANDLITKCRWLANLVMVDPEMHDVQVQMQQHVLYWGNKRGV